jgi:hypothetical protein
MTQKELEVFTEAGDDAVVPMLDLPPVRFAEALGAIAEEMVAQGQMTVAEATEMVQAGAKLYVVNRAGKADLN